MNQTSPLDAVTDLSLSWESVNSAILSTTEPPQVEDTEAVLTAN